MSSLLAVMVLTGCAGTQGTESHEPAADVAARIVKDLHLEENVAETTDRMLNGLLFFDEGDITEGSLYVSQNKADTVAVFYTDDPEKVMEKTDTYLKTLKAQLETYAPSEVFKVDNGIVEHNDYMVLVIICDDLQSAKDEAAKILE
ncbi:MAG: DUF4358 domain-containing protein [Solobacterium sp.]|nr:DUF4358 domain-containing protein [Solobacterium sp.]